MRQLGSTSMINLSNQSLKSLPDIPLEIYKLDVSNNAFEELVFSQKLNLSMLNLSKNQLKSVKQLENLENLTVLNLSYNALQEIPIGLPLKLKALILNNNQLSSIKNLKLYSINTLVLSNNQIFHLENVYGLGLKKLSLGHNLLTEFPNLETSDLRELKVNDNQISRVDLEQIKLIPKLEILDLGNNLIKEFRDIIHLMSLKLRQLNLKGNPICLLKDYQVKIRKMLPSIWVLDGKNIRNLEKSIQDVHLEKHHVEDQKVEDQKVEIKKRKRENTVSIPTIESKIESQPAKDLVDLKSPKNSGLLSVSHFSKKENQDGKKEDKEELLRVLEEEKEVEVLKW